MSPDREDEILATLREFRREVREEFQVVKAKQDLTNGRVNDLEAERDRRAGYEAREHEEEALGRADTLSWRAVTVPAVVAVIVAALAIAASHIWPT